MREYVWLECTVCGNRNYRTQKETRGAEPMHNGRERLRRSRQIE